MIDPTTQTLSLEGLHLPQPLGLWPLAWGWWAVILAVLCGIILSVLFIRNWRNARRAKNEALRLLGQNGDGYLDPVSMNTLLRQAALSYYPRQQIAGLTGTQWQAFLDRQLPEASRGFVLHQSLWHQGLFSRKPLTQAELDKCKHQTQVWLKKALPPSKGKLAAEAAHFHAKHTAVRFTGVSDV